MPPGLKIENRRESVKALVLGAALGELDFKSLYARQRVEI